MRPKLAQLDLAVGTMLGKYEILRKLATGGMAEIYLARVRGTAGFEKLVVIKRILPSVADDPNFVRMFLDEARLAATLQHPNIADVNEVGEHEGSPFFAMQFIHGQDVRAIRYGARQRKEQVPLAVSLAIIHGTASALDYAHDRCGSDGKNLGLVHRDVSSSNILVSYEGAIKLIDFGIARAKSHSQQTQVGMLKGKIPYMSPEQCRGHALDRRSDLFSLGVMLYELTAGRRPFQGDNDFAIMEQIVHGRAQAPSTLMRNYPPELDAIVMRLLEPKLEDRYQTAEQMLQELDPFMAQHQLWVSPKSLSRYMRELFSDAMSAWDRAIEGGVTLAQYVATTTAPSAQSMLVTPPSSFPAVMPLSKQLPAMRISEQIDVDIDVDLDANAAASPDADPGASLELPTRAHVPLPVAIATPVAPVARSRTWIAMIAVGILALGAGGYVGYQQFAHTDEPKTSPPIATDVPTVTMPVTEPTTVEATPPAKTADPVATVPAVTGPSAAESAIVAPPDPDPDPGFAAKVSSKRPKPPPPKPPPPKGVTPPKPPKPPKPAAPPPKDQKQWDLDSPFLPNQ